MNRWKIEIVLKSGKEIECLYIGYEDTSQKVFDKMFAMNKNKDCRTFNGFYDMEEKKNVLVCIDDVSAVSISIASAFRKS